MSPSIRVSIRVVLVLLTPIAWSCSPPAEEPGELELREALSREDLAGLDAWLHCDDCTDGELAFVRDDVGTQAIPLFREYLRRPHTQVEPRLRANIRAEWESLPGSTVDDTTYVRFFLENYQATVQKRAAIALGELNDTAGLRAIREEPSFAGYRSDVQAAIEEALVASGAPGFVPTGPDRIVLRPSALTLARGDSTVLEAILLDANGNPSTRPLTWSSADPGLVTVSSSTPGYASVVAIDEGTTRVVVTAGALADTTSVTVTPPGGPMSSVRPGADTLTRRR